MDNEKKLKIGQEVLIFDNNDKNILKPFIRGTVVDCKTVEGSILIYHEWSMEVYTVLGEDKNEYVGCYPKSPAMNIYFLTKKEYINYLKSLKEDSEKIKEIILSLKEEDEEKKQVKREICKVNGHDFGEWKENKQRESWTRKCKCCGDKEISLTKPIEVLYKEIEELSNNKRK